MLCPGFSFQDDFPFLVGADPGVRPQRAHSGTGSQPVIGCATVGAGLNPAPTIDSTWDATVEAIANPRSAPKGHSERSEATVLVVKDKESQVARVVGA